MTTPHPWRELRAQAHLFLHIRDLAPGVRGATDGEHVWMSRRLLQVERRCTLAHELEHLRRGQTCCVSGVEEVRVRHHAARWLLPSIHDIARALVLADGCRVAAADELWVDVPTFDARLDARHLHPAEWAILDRKLREELHP